MLLWLFISASFAFLCKADDIPPWTEYWYTQTLNHFNPQDERTFQQRYLLYDDYWNQAEQAPIFFYSGNEGNIEDFWNNTGFIFDIAPEFNALVIFAEHRYYGETLPFGNDSFTPENLQYLTIELAIGDYAVLLTELKQQWNVPNSQVVVFGGSYGGILAALCRIHYPAVFEMALAASAPVPQTLDLINSTIFFELVTVDYQESDERCPNIVREGYSELINYAAQNRYDLITSTFNLCTELTEDYLEYLELWIRNAFLTMAMGDYPYSADFLGDLPAWPVNVSCNILLENQDNPMLAIALVAGLYYNGSSDNELQCFNITDEYIECADQTGCGLGNDAISWDYQMCTEIIYEMDTNNVTDMFPPRIWHLSNLTDYCEPKYGTIPNPTWMQIYFPEDVASAGSYIIWSNGLLDPWHGGGYLNDLSLTMPAIIIPPGAHHLDIRGSNPADPQDVIEARYEEKELIKQWLYIIQESKVEKIYEKVEVKRLRR